MRESENEREMGESERERARGEREREGMRRKEKEGNREGAGEGAYTIERVFCILGVLCI